MNKTLHSGASRLLTLIYAIAIAGILPACTDDAERELPDKGKGETATLELSLSVPPIVETKAVICESDSGSEARKAGFYYEMQVLTTDTATTTVTKAASSLKNIYAFLFKSNGDFNGRASLTTASTGSGVTLVFTNIADPSAANGRLVVIANDATAGVDYASSTTFPSFKGNYTEFQNLTLTSTVTSNINIPYVGSATVTLLEGSFAATATVQLYRMLAQINLTNNTFSIEGGPSRNAINLYNTGNMYFGTPNNYDGTGTTATASGRYKTTATAGNNANTNTWFVGENIQTTADPAKALYIRLGTDTKSAAVNTNPAIGEEYIASSGGYAFTYDVYLKNIALRRNNIYNVTVNVSGTLERHLELAATANSGVSVKSTVVHGGLNIGTLHGVSSTKNQLLQPNTSGTMATDNISKQWEDAKVYCAQLQLGGVVAGSWYLPNFDQLKAIYRKWQDIKEYSSGTYYSAFYSASIFSYYWSSTEYAATHAWVVDFFNGRTDYYFRTNTYRVRCVRDL